MDPQTIIISLLPGVLKRFLKSKPKLKLVLKNSDGRPELLLRPHTTPFTDTGIVFYIENKSKNASASYINLEIKLPRELEAQNEIYSPDGNYDRIHWKRMVYSKLGQGIIWRFEGKSEYRIGPEDECPIGRITFYIYPKRQYQNKYKIEYKISTKDTKPQRGEVLLIMVEG